MHGQDILHRTQDNNRKSVPQVSKMELHNIGSTRPLSKFMVGLLLLIWIASAVLLCQNAMFCSLNMHSNTISGIPLAYLTKVKKQTPQEKQTGIVYEVSCKDCDKVYIGETKRTMKVWLSEHRQAVRKGVIR